MFLLGPCNCQSLIFTLKWDLFPTLSQNVKQRFYYCSSRSCRNNFKLEVWETPLLPSSCLNYGYKHVINKTAALSGHAHYLFCSEMRKVVSGSKHSYDWRTSTSLLVEKSYKSTRDPAVTDSLLIRDYPILLILAVNH